MTKHIVASGSPFEERLGFSRAVRIGQVVAVSGTAAVTGPDDVEGQARECLRIVQTALRDAGADLSDVIRVRVMLIDIDDWEIVGRVHGEVFASVRPALTVLQVSRFIDPRWLVEIEVDAVVCDAEPGPDS